MPSLDPLSFDCRRARRIGIVSDTHGVLDNQVAAALAGCDLLVHAGDVGNADVLERLRGISVAHAVRGNNDTARKWPDGQVQTLNSLPACCIVELTGGNLALVHGHQFNPVAARHRKLRQAFADARAVVYGHSHRLVCDLEQQPWVINPGAAGRARTYGGVSCLVLQINEREWTLSTHRFAR